MREYDPDHFSFVRQSKLPANYFKDARRTPDRFMYYLSAVIAFSSLTVIAWEWFK